PIFPQHIGAQPDMLDRSIFAPQLGIIIMKCLSAMEPRDEVVQRLLIGMELSEVVPQILFSRVTEQFQFSAIGSLNDPIRAHPKEANRGVLKKIGQLTFAPTQPFLGLL